MNALLEFVRFKNVNIWSPHLLLGSELVFNDKYPKVYFKKFVKKADIEKVSILDNKSYKIIGVRSYGLGVYLNREVLGSTLKMRTYQQAKKDHLFWCKVDTKNGTFGIINDTLKDGVGSSNMTFAKIDTTVIYTDYLQLFFKSKKFNTYMDSMVVGTTNRKYIKFNNLLNDIKIPLPQLNIQEKIVSNYKTKIKLSEEQRIEAEDRNNKIDKYLKDILKLKDIKDPDKKILNFIKYEKINSWSYRDLLGNYQLISSKYETIRLNQKPDYYREVFRGKSPKYSEDSDNFILNQKCIRWNYIEIVHSKKVQKNWYENIDNKFFTKKNDILINSTGDGTIGRASIIYKDYTNLIYDSHILLLRVNEEKINPLFLTYFINSSLGQDQIANIKSAVATKQTELGLTNLKNIQFILPDITIQNEIALYIDSEKKEIHKLLTNSLKNKEIALLTFEREIFNEN